MLKHAGKPVDLDGKVGALNNQGNNIVVLEAVKGATGDVKALPSQSIKPETPLANRDPNARPRMPPVLLKSASPVNRDENQSSHPSSASNKTSTYLKQSNNIPSGAPAFTPNPKAPGATAASTKIFPNLVQPSGSPLHSTSRSTAAPTPMPPRPNQPLASPVDNKEAAAEDQTRFWGFHASWLERYRTAYSGDTQGSLPILFYEHY